MSKTYVCSTATTSIAFAEYAPFQPNVVPSVVRRVVIRGGANAPQKRTLFTPRGVATAVTPDEMAFLLSNASFLKMARAGYFTVISDDRDVEKAARDMAAKDGCAPKTPGDFNNALAGKTGRGVSDILAAA